MRKIDRSIELKASPLTNTSAEQGTDSDLTAPEHFVEHAGLGVERGKECCRRNATNQSSDFENVLCIFPKSYFEDENES